MPWGSHVWGSSIWGGGGVGTGKPIRTPVAGLYIDNLRFDSTGEGVDLINTIPEHQEERVLITAHILFQVIAYAFPLDNKLKVWVTVGDGPRTLALDEAGLGFQNGYNGPDSSISYRKSPGSLIYDEAAVALDPETDFPSHTKITVEVEAEASADLLRASYYFTTQYTEAPVVDDILWLNPRRARLRFREKMQQDEQPGGTLYLKTLSGGFEFVAPNKLIVRNLTPHTNWIGYWVGTTGSAYPQNNGYFLISAIDAANEEVTVTVGDKPFKNDNGIDKDADGNVIRNRDLRGVISSYAFSADPSSEEDDVTCAYPPMVVSVRKPDVIELPLYAEEEQYVIVDFHDDISIGRRYNSHLIKAINEYEDVADSSSVHQFLTPTFGSPEKRVKLWDFIPELDKEEDEAEEDQLQKMAVVLQDLINVLWYRCDSLQYLYDPDRAPDSWIPYLLYTLGNPFRLPLNLLEQRRLCSVLTAVYKQVGTAKIIEETLAFFLGGTFIVQPFQTADWWVLGESQIGIDTILGPSNKYAKNCYEIISSQALTADQERAVRHIAQALDPVYMHLVRIVEPGETSGTLQFWTLGASGLGYTSVLAP